MPLLRLRAFLSAGGSATHPRKTSSALWNQLIEHPGDAEAIWKWPLFAHERSRQQREFLWGGGVLKMWKLLELLSSCAEFEAQFLQFPHIPP